MIRDLPDSATCSTCCHGAICPQRSGDLALALFFRLPGGSALGFHMSTAVGDDSIIDSKVNLAVGDVDIDDIALMNKRDQPAFRRFRRDVTDGKA